MNIEMWDIIKWHTSLYETPKKQRQTCLFAEIYLNCTGFSKSKR